MFCYVVGDALKFCNDVRASNSHPGKYYSYEACATPTRQRCINAYYKQEKQKFEFKTAQFNPNVQNCLNSGNLGGGNIGGNNGGNFGVIGGGFKPLGKKGGSSDGIRS